MLGRPPAAQSLRKVRGVFKTHIISAASLTRPRDTWPYFRAPEATFPLFNDATGSHDTSHNVVVSRNNNNNSNHERNDNGTEDHACAWLLRALLLERQLKSGSLCSVTASAARYPTTTPLTAAAAAHSGTSSSPSCHHQTMSEQLQFLAKMVETVFSCSGSSTTDASSEHPLYWSPQGKNKSQKTGEGKNSSSHQPQQIVVDVKTSRKKRSGVATAHAEHCNETDQAAVRSLQASITHDVMAYLDFLRGTYTRGGDREKVGGSSNSGSSTHIVNVNAYSAKVSTKNDEFNDEKELWPWRDEAQVVLALVAGSEARETLENLELLDSLLERWSRAAVPPSLIGTSLIKINRINAVTAAVADPAERPFVDWLLSEAARRLVIIGSTRGCCLPWLLYRRAVRRHLVLSTISYEEISSWAAAAVDRICAASWEELKERSDHYKRPSWLHSSDEKINSLLRGSAMEEKSSCATPGLFGAIAPALSLDYMQPRYEVAKDHRLDFPFRSTFALQREERGASLTHAPSSYQEEDSNSSRALASPALYFGLAPFWSLVMTELLESGWQALDTLHSSNSVTAATSPSPLPPLYQTQKRRGAPPSDATDATSRAAEFHAVGVYLGMRRILSSLGAHSRLSPLLLVYAHTSGGRDTRRWLELTSSSSPPVNSAIETCDQATMQDDHSASPDAAQWWALIQAGTLRGCSNALLWRETVLIEAATLVTLGHTSAHAVDLIEPSKSNAEKEAAQMGAVTALQEACIGHLQLLLSVEQANLHGERRRPHKRGDAVDLEGQGQATREAGNVSITPTRAQRLILSRLSPRTRSELVSKLQEGLRLSTKYLLCTNQYVAVAALYARCPRAIGSSWEVGKALLRCGRPREALACLQQFLFSTQQQLSSSSRWWCSYMACNVPHSTQALVLEAITNVAANNVSTAMAGRLAGSLLDAAEGAESVEEIVSAVFDDEYARVRVVCRPIPPALCFDALLRGVLLGVSAVTTVSGEGGADAGGRDGSQHPPTPQQLDGTSTNNVGTATCSCEGVLLASALLRRYVDQWKEQDGLLGSTVEVLVNYFLKARQQHLGLATSDSCSSSPSLQPHSATLKPTDAHAMFAEYVEASLLSSIIFTQHCSPEIAVVRRTMILFLQEDYLLGVRVLLAAMEFSLVARVCSPTYVTALLEALPLDCL